MAKSKTILPRTPSNESDIAVWADALIQKWQSKINTLGIQGTGDLVRSFRFIVEWESRMVSATAVEFLKRVQFTFNYYGKMLDYGLGRGMDFKTRFAPGTSPTQYPRKRKPWIADAYVAERKVFAKMVSQQAQTYAASLGQTFFEESLNPDSIIKY